MGRMVRKQIYIKPEQEEALDRRSKELGISEAELIRRRISQPSRMARSIPWNKQAWLDELAFIRERARIQELGKTRGWTREDLYEERFERYSR